MGPQDHVGNVNRDAFFVVLAEEKERDGLYFNEPDVTAQFAPDEDAAKFEAAWNGEEWQFGRRVRDA